MGGHCEFIISASIPVPESGCWLWAKGWSAKGYGSVRLGGQNYAHRLSYQEFVGPIPAGMQVCHKCDTPACCNPSHLFLGTGADNLADASRKGRMHPGEKNYNNKLTNELVGWIRSSTLSCRAIARKLGMEHSTIAMCRRGDTWRHV